MPGQPRVFILAIIFMTVVLPIFGVMHDVTKWKSTKGLSGTSSGSLEDL